MNFSIQFPYWVFCCFILLAVFALGFLFGAVVAALKRTSEES